MSATMTNGKIVLIQTGAWALLAVSFVVGYHPPHFEWRLLVGGGALCGAFYLLGYFKGAMRRNHPKLAPRPPKGLCQADMSKCDWPHCACPPLETHVQTHGPLPGAPFK